MHGQGIPSEDQGLYQRKLVVQQGSSDTDHSLEVFEKKLKHLHVNWLLELWSLRNVAR